MKTKVSIIIAAYNASKTINEALFSVYNQSFEDWECIIVDGASKDNTIEIAKSYCQKDSRFRYISEPDNGIYDAFNKGWKMAKGEWIHFLGSDDRLTKDSFTEMLTENHSEAAVLAGSTYIETIDGKIKIQKSKEWVGCHQAKLTRRSVIEAMGGFSEKYKILADKDLFLRIKNSDYTVINFNNVVAYFSMNGISQNIFSLFNKFVESCEISRKNGSPLSFTYKLKYLFLGISSCIYRKIKKCKYKLENNGI